MGPVRFKARLHMEDVKTRAGVSLLLTIMLVCSAQALNPTSTSAEPCVPNVGGVDLSKANGHSCPRFGSARGQTFLARDTLLKSITAWRVAWQDTNNFRWHIFILETDSLGSPAPDTTPILLDGPTVSNPIGDGVNPIPFRFEFNPPFALPGPGLYEFAILGAPCSGFFEILFDNNNTYPDGQTWLHGRTEISGCRIRNYPRGVPESDMVFEIEFCDTGTVPVLPETWGTVKSQYR